MIISVMLIRLKTNRIVHLNPDNLQTANAIKLYIRLLAIIILTKMISLLYL